MDYFSSKNVQFYLPIGIPDGMELFQATAVTITPKIVSITPSVGSPAGSIIVA
jgi:hypothetical protein